TADVPGLDSVAASHRSTNCSAVFTSLVLIVCQSNTDRAVSVTQTGSDTALVALQTIFRAYAVGDLVLFRTIGVEGVTNAELEAGEVRSLVHDHVVVTNGVSSCESSTDVSLVETTAEWIGYAWQVLGGDVSLTTEVQLTPAVTSQTQSGLTTEQTVTL